MPLSLLRRYNTLITSFNQYKLTLLHSPAVSTHEKGTVELQACVLYFLNDEGNQGCAAEASTRKLHSLKVPVNSSSSHQVHSSSMAMLSVSTPDRSCRPLFLSLIYTPHFLWSQKYYSYVFIDRPFTVGPRADILWMTEQGIVRKGDGSVCFPERLAPVSKSCYHNATGCYESSPSCTTI